MIEEKSKKKEKNIIKSRKKAKKTLEILILIIIITWASLGLIDYLRSEKDKVPLVIVYSNSVVIKDIEINEYFGLGYVYREYNTGEDITTDFKPFWSKPSEYEITSKYPILKDDYKVYENPEKKSKINDILYFYNDDRTLMYTYKCQSKTCDIAKTHDTELELANYLQYVFIKEEETNYIVDSNKNEIIGEFNAIVESTAKNNKAISTNGEFITYDGENYGIIKIDNEVKNIQSSIYKSIKYHQPTNKYIVEGKHWMVIDDNKNYFTSNEEILDIAISNNEMYFVVKRNEGYNVRNKEAILQFTKDYQRINVIDNKFYVVDEDKLLILDEFNKVYNTTPMPITISLDKNPIIYDDSKEAIKIYIQNLDGNTYIYKFNKETFGTATIDKVLTSELEK